MHHMPALERAPVLVKSQSGKGKSDSGRARKYVLQARRSAADRPDGQPFMNNGAGMRLLVFVVSMMLAPVLVAADGPLEQLRTSVDAILEVLRSPDLQQADKREKIATIASRQFSFRDMAQLTLATNWKIATAEEKHRYTDLFTRLLNQTYLASLGNYADATVTYRQEQIRGTRAVVETTIVNDGVEIPVSYRFRKRSDDGAWWVYDVVIEGVSLIANYRTEYREVVRNNGIDGLLNQLEQKVGSQDPTSQDPTA